MLDIGEAVDRSAYAAAVMSDPAASDVKKRNAVQTAVLLAVPAEL